MAILPNALSYIYKELLAAPAIRKVVDAILRMTIPRSILINGQLLHLNRKDAAICAAIRFGIYEKGSRAVFSKLINKGATVVDVGAHVGLYSVLAEQAGAFVYAFEPATDNYDILRKNIKAHPYKLALGDKNGPAKLYLHPSNKGKHALKPTDEHTECEEVDERTLDTLVDSIPIRSLDILKIDAEGYEPEVFAGARRTIEKYKPDILFELAPQRRDPTASVSLVKFLEGLGYVLFAINENSGALTRIVSDQGRYPLIAAMKGNDPYVNVLARSPRDRGSLE
jgi:FkbM family methyltransferase